MNAVLRLSSVPTNRALNSLFINAQLIVHDEMDGYLSRFGSEGFTVTKIKVLQADETPPDLPTELPPVDLNYHAYVPGTRFTCDRTGRVVVIPLKIRIDTARSLAGVQTESDSELAVMVRPLFKVERSNRMDFKPLGEPSFHDVDYAYKKASDTKDYQDVLTEVELIQFEIFVKKTNTDMLGDAIFPAQTNFNQNGVVDAPAASATHPVDLTPIKE